MKSYSQNQEDLFVLNYFKGFKGTLLEIGSNDGRTLSNSLLLIENGWKAHLVEPGETFTQLFELHKNNPLVQYYNYGIGAKEETVSFWQSGAHVQGGADRGLVSSANYHETERWRQAGVSFIASEIKLTTFDKFHEYAGYPQFDFISIDAEGFDWLILQQIDLEKVGCKCLCIEWNGDPELSTKFTQYCAGYKLALVNNENLIFVK